MDTPSLLEVTAERAHRKSRFEGGIATRTEPQAVRGAAPPRAAFDERRRRFIDQHGRIYVLPLRGDALSERLVDQGEVRAFYEPDDYAQRITSTDPRASGVASAHTLRRGFAYAPPPRETLPTLSGDVFMYCMRPRRAQQYDESFTNARLPPLPPVSGSASDAAPGEMLHLYQCDQNDCVLDDGERYVARVRKTMQKRRAQKGQVILSDVQLVN